MKKSTAWTLSDLNKIRIDSPIDPGLVLDAYLGIYGTEEELRWAYLSLAEDCEITVDSYAEHRLGRVREAVAERHGPDHIDAFEADIAGQFCDAWNDYRRAHPRRSFSTTEFKRVSKLISQCEDVRMLRELKSELDAHLATIEGRF